MRSCFLAILKIAVLNKDNSFVMAFLWLVSAVLLWGVFTVTAQAQKPDSFDECLYCISMNWNRKVLKCKNTTLFFYLGRSKSALYFPKAFILHHNIIWNEICFS